MSRNPVFTIAILALSATTLACGFTINLPVTRIQTGPTEVDDIYVPLLDSDEVADVRLNFAAGRLFLDPGAEDALIDGQATYNVEDFEPEVEIDGNNITIGFRENSIEFAGIPSFDYDDLENTWRLKLNEDAPMNLRIDAGAYEGELELGGLSLHSVRIFSGASSSEVSFSKLNQIEMDSFRYETGASSVTVTGLANTNAERLTFKSGAGEYRLDFSGDLQRDMTVDIEAGVSSIVIVVPEGMNARVTVDSALSSVNTRGDWRRAGGRYVMEGGGDAPTITINIDMGLGDLELRN